LVRLEVTRALARGIRVVPLLIDETEMPSLEELPEDLKGLKFRQAFRVDSGVDFHHHLDRLCAAIEAASPGAAGATDSATSLLPKPGAAARSRDESQNTGPRPHESSALPLRPGERPSGSKLARASLICSTVGPVLAYFVVLGLHEGVRLFAFVLFVLSAVAIVCGHLARKHIRRNPSLSGNRLAVTGLIVGYIVLLAVTLITIAIIHDSMR
jgi:hypothetical protein